MFFPSLISSFSFMEPICLSQNYSTLPKYATHLLSLLMLFYYFNGLLFFPHTFSILTETMPLLHILKIPWEKYTNSSVYHVTVLSRGKEAEIPAHLVTREEAHQKPMRSWEEQHNQDFGFEHIRSFRRQDHSIPNLINPDKNKSVLSLPHFLKGQFILLVTQANNLKII